MSVLWVTLFLLHQGYALVPVVTAQPGEPVTLTCTFKDKIVNVIWLHWYKQSAEESLKMIVMVMQNAEPTYGPEFPANRFKTTYDEEISNLTILSPTEQDEGMYHCALIDWRKAFWTATYLSIKGNNERTSSYTVVHQSAVSGPARPAETLQCSVLSDSQNKACSDVLSVFWFRAGSAKSSPNIIYTDGNRADKCKKTSDTQRRCSYNFSKNISSSDGGTFYCAVATCGQIILGNGRNKEPDKTSSSETTGLIVTVICLAVSVIVNIVFICYRIQISAGKRFKESSTRHNDTNQPGQDINEGWQDLNYAALHFSEGRTPGSKKTRALKTEESVYSQVKGSV